MYYQAVLERIDNNLNRILDENDDGVVVSETIIEAIDQNEAQYLASVWAESFLTFGDHYQWERHPFRYLAVAAFGTTYGIGGYCSRVYRCVGDYVRAGGYKLFLQDME